MRIKTLAALMMLVIFITGCAMFQLPQTPEDKSTFFMSYYMAQLRDYNARYDAALTGDGASDMDMAVLEAKHSFLVNAWNPISVYDSYAVSGEIPPAELEAQINALIAKLEAMLREGQ